MPCNLSLSWLAIWSSLLTFNSIAPTIATATCTDPSVVTAIPLTATGDYERLLSYMQGSFDSHAQSVVDTDYYAITLEMRPIWQHRSDGSWLYVEQAMSNLPYSPYRQRVYKVVPLQDGQFESIVYELPQPKRFVGKFSDISFWGQFTPDSLLLRNGCSITLHREGDRFVGKTDDHSCESSLRGASYATSEVNIGADGLQSWDRGFDAKGKQVWGAVKGAYRFVKHKNLAAITATNLTNITDITANNPSMYYPTATRGNATDNYHGTTVADPYRWLEDENSADTRVWIDAQNALTQAQISDISFRPQLKQRLTELWNYPQYGIPSKHGGYYYFTKNDGLQNHGVLYRQKTPTDTPEVFLDPNVFSADGSVALSGIDFSKSGERIVYATSQGGSDWQEFHVIYDRPSRALPEKLQHIKFSGASWLGEEGFFYSRYPAPQSGRDLSDENVGSKVYFHKIGTQQDSDILVFENKKQPRISYNANVTPDGKYIILYASDGAASGNALYYVAADKWRTQKFKPLITDFKNNHTVIDNIGDKLLVLTNRQADRYRLVLIDPKKAAESKWQEVIAQQSEVLEGVQLAEGNIVAQYLKDVSSHLYVYDLQGKNKREIALPTLGMITGIWAAKPDNELFYQFESFLYPPTIFKYEVSSQSTTIFHQPNLPFKLDDYETRQVFYPSKDGTKIPMFITARKDIQLNSANPTLLYGYGGFNVTRNPEFKVENLPFYESGGIYAVANLRGGSEYGEAWHKAGMLDKKQNVFDDYIAAAEYLIAQKYTRPERLAATGRSNGGLLIGAVMNQRPDLFAVALPTVGVMDMLRYQKFTIGWAWTSEFGSSDNADQFKYLYAYSPYHNIKPDKPYPATLVLTAERDDRVVPAHSFKYLAELQHQYKGNNPILARIEKQSGHASGGAGKTVSARIEEYADIWSFVFRYLRMYP